MPRLSQYLVRAALVWLALGYTLGGLTLANKGLGLSPWLGTLRLPHVHMLLAGWTAQLALGVAFWILPRLGGGSRGNERLMALAGVALNLGVVAAALYDPLKPWLPVGSIEWLPVAAGLLYLVAALAALAHLWPRVLPLPVVDTHKQQSSE